MLFLGLLLLPNVQSIVCLSAPYILLLRSRKKGVTLPVTPARFPQNPSLCWGSDVFGCPGSGKKMPKFQDAFRISILDTF